MSPRHADPFARLLRWYPARWRDDNGDVLVGTLRDHADLEGRRAPSRQEVLSAVVNGVALRLDARVALWSSVVSLVLNAGAWILVLVGRGGAAAVVTAGVAPVLTLLGLIALVRFRGWVAPLRALVVLVVLAAAIILSALTQAAWALGFDLADANRPLTGLAAAWMPLLATAWIGGAVGLAVLVDGLLSRSHLPRVGRITIATLSGVLAAPALGAGLLNPLTSAVVAVGVAGGALGTLGRRDAPPHRVPASASASDVGDSRRAARWLSGISLVGGAVGVVYALTGTSWSPGASDGTVAVGQGITISLAASIPLLAAAGLRSATGRGRVVVWGPLCMAVLAVVAVAIAYTAAPEWAGMGSWMTLSAALGGAGVAWWITPRLRGRFVPRLAVGCAIGFAYAALLGITVIPALAFVVPALAAVVGFSTRRRGRPASAQALGDTPATPA